MKVVGERWEREEKNIKKMKSKEVEEGNIFSYFLRFRYIKFVFDEVFINIK